MNKLTAIKIKYNDGTYSDEIPVSVLAENVLLSGKSVNLADVLGDVKVAAAGNIQQQLDQLASKKIDMQLLDDYIANQLGDATTAWLNEHIAQIGATVVLDSSLKISGAAADAKAVGDRVNQAIQTIQNQLSDKVDNGYVEDGVAYFTSGDDILFSITGIGGGGGGGGGGETPSTSMVLQNLTGWVSKTISLNSNCELTLSWSSIMDGYITGPGTLSVQVRGATALTKTVAQGRFIIDIKKYLQSGSNKVKVTITDAYGSTKSVIFTIDVISLSITSTFDEGLARTGTFDVLYTVTGAGDKNVHFIIDGVEIATDLIQTSGRQTSHNFSALSHGAHSLEIYASATADGEEVESNHLFLSVIAVQDGNTTPIISSSYNITTVKQYENIIIPYYVYNPASFTAQINIYVNDTLYSTQTVDRTQQIITYRAKTPDSITIRIACGSVEKSFIIAVDRADSSLTPITERLSLYLSTEGRSNNEANPGSWVYNSISSEFTNFNFVSDGWLHDENGNTILRITGNARLNIGYLLFQNDFRTNGKTIEFEFRTSNVLDYDSEIITCWSNDRGIKFTAQKATMKSEQTTISTQYKEDEHVRISFVVGSNDTRLFYIYINGILSGVTQYAIGDDFAQANPVSISIGSSDCTVDLYNIRVYDKALSAEEVITNWIADTQDVNEMLDRFERNNIRDNGEISIDKLPANLPYFLIEGEALPQAKKDAKIISGRYVDPVNPERSFTYTNASCDVQGTSSQGYPRKNYKIKFKNFTNNAGETSSTYCLRGPEESLPSKVFCFKADYASSESANNVELVRLYEDLCPVKSEAQQEDGTGLVRQGIDGVPIVIFWYKPSTGVTTFMGKYNFNFDKSSPVFGFEDGDESWETTDNSNDWAMFRRADYDGNGWLSAFEARFPDTDPAYEDGTELSKVAKWINSTSQDDAPYNIQDPALCDIAFSGVYYSNNSNDNVKRKASNNNIFSLVSYIRTPQCYRWDIEKIKASQYYHIETNSVEGRTVFPKYRIGVVNPTAWNKARTEDGYSYNEYHRARVIVESYNKSYSTLSDYPENDYISASESMYSSHIIKLTNIYDSDFVNAATTNLGIRFIIPVVYEDIDNYYICWDYGSSTDPYGIIWPEGVKNGDIIYAGKNTPYYGLRNINDIRTDFETPVIYGDYQFDFDSVQYRIAKFRYELDNWFNKDDVLFYYLFTEFFLMIDSRVKNSFPTKYGSTQGAKWMWLPYDMDTAIGINNEGALVFDYSLEDTDMLSSTAGVYNGYKTVMWNNVRDAFPAELAAMYQRLRANNLLSYDVVEERFENHQNVWSETIFNEDAYYKYIQPFINDGEDNLYMCLGSKAEQRKWWLYNRFRYIDSKYTAGYARTSYIQARVYQKSDLTITPYASIYASADFDSNLVKVKADRNRPTEIESPDTWDPGGADAVLRIYSADQLASLGDLSPFYIGAVSFAAGTKLKEIKVGDGAQGYKNENLISLTLGNNTLLKSLDVRNCPNLRSAIDISGCTNIEEIYFDGTSITGLSLPKGGVISTLHLPNTITNLVILNQNNITDFVLNDYSNITTLRIEDSSVDEMPILLGMADNGRIRLTNVSWETSTVDEVEAIVHKLYESRGLDENGNNTEKAQISGTLHAAIINDWQLERLESFPELIVTYDQQIIYNWLLHQFLARAYTQPLFSEDITELGNWAFASASFKSIYFPNVTKLGYRCFAYGRTDFSIKDSLPALEELSSTDTFLQNGAITNIESTTLRTIKGKNSFSQLSELKSIYLPALENVTTCEGLFGSGQKLEYVIAPKLITDSTLNNTFSSDSTLKYIELYRIGAAGNANAISSKVLEHLVLRDPVNLSVIRNFDAGSLQGEGPCVNVYVARDLIENYKIATNWSVKYANGWVDFKALEDYTIDGTLTGAFNYDLIGMEIYHEQTRYDL